MNILMTSLVYWPDSTGNGPIMTDLAEELASRGHNVTVVCGFPHYGRDEMPSEYRGRLTMLEEHNGVTLRRVYHAGAGSTNALWKIIGYLVFSLTAIIGGLRTGPADVILAPSPPLTVGISSWVLGICKRAPFIYNIQDLFPEAYINTGSIKSPIAIALSKALAQFVYHRAARIVCVMESIADQVADYGVSREKIVVIPNWSDPSEITPCDKDNSFATEQGISDGFVVQYAGNIGTSQRLDLVIECAEQLRDEGFHFLIIGSGTLRGEIEQMLQDKQLPNVTLLETQPRERLSEVLCACDVALVPLAGKMSQTSFPSKIYTIMASARPVVAALDQGSSPRRFVEEHGCGITIDPDELPQLIAALRTLKRDRERCRKMGQQARKQIVGLKQRETSIDAYERVLAELVGEGT
jgi:colanic acid biosynthesis glycosyl transferase WcaI